MLAAGFQDRRLVGGKMSDWLTLVPDMDSDDGIGPRDVLMLLPDIRERRAGMWRFISSHGPVME